VEMHVNKRIQTRNKAFISLFSFGISNLNYKMQKTQCIAVAKGDGIGPEIMDSVLAIFKAAAVPLDYEFVEMGKEIFEAGHNSGMTPEAMSIIEELGILFKGPMETPKGKGVKSINVTARKVWNTYANKRIFRTLKGVDTVYSKAGIPINITIVRENIEDTYGGIEHMLTSDVALCRRFVTRPGSEQVHRFTFEMAKRRGAKKVVCGHKANIMKLTDGLFLETFYQVAKEYPEINPSDIIIDDLAMKLVVKPNEFDIIVLPNLQGDIISDLCAGLVGGLGFAPSANIGDFISIFEAVHGTAPDITGKNIANPTSLLLSGIMMLRHIGLAKEGNMIENALLSTLEDGIHTRDFGTPGTQGKNTTEFATAIIERLGRKPSVGALPAGENFEYTSSSRPVEKRLIQTQWPVNTQVCGMDLFVEFERQPLELAHLIQSRIGDDMKLVTISNRGTQVWPTGSVFTDCVDQYRVRIETQSGDSTQRNKMLELAASISSSVTICSVEMLTLLDGKRAYSLAQGQ